MARTAKLALAAVLLGIALTLPSRAGAVEALVVGDSLEVLTSPYLQRHLPGVGLTIDAEGGYNSNQIRGLFERSYDPAQSVIVFDAGTNDNPAYSQILAGNLSAVAAAIGDRCMVVPTIHGLIVDGVGNQGKNATVAQFAASRPGTQVPDWAGAVARDPGLLQSDDLHPTPEGADFRAQLIAAGVRGCIAFQTRATAVPSVQSGPDLAPARRVQRRSSELAAAVGGALLGRLAAGMARRQLAFAAALSAASLRLRCDDLGPLCPNP